MRKYPGIPELLQQFTLEQGADEGWVTMQELRDRFRLIQVQGNTVSGFLHRRESGPFEQFPYLVTRIERRERSHSSDPPKCRYLV
jgi:hypothetical protein